MMPPLRVIIVDDERLARSELKSMLERHEGVTVVGEAHDVPSAAELIERTAPDVVFLDIQMPGSSGFDLLNRIDIQCRIVFTTAFNEYAVRAFEVNALDYIMKPIRAERLAQAVERLTTSRREPAEVRQFLEDSDTLLVRSGGRTRSLRVSEIVVVRADGDYTEVLTERGATELVHKTMKEWEQRLPVTLFVRIHRSTIVNLRYVDRFDEVSRRELLVYLRHVSKPLAVSRRYATRLRRKMS